MCIRGKLNYVNFGSHNLIVKLPVNTKLMCTCVGD